MRTMQSITFLDGKKYKYPLYHPGTNRQTDGQTDRQTGSHTDRQRNDKRIQTDKEKLVVTLPSLHPTANPSPSNTSCTHTSWPTATGRWWELCAGKFHIPIIYNYTHTSAEEETMSLACIQILQNQSNNNNNNNNNININEGTEGVDASMHV